MSDDGVLETRDDGKRVVRFERHLRHPVERVWAALTEPDQLIAWWGEAAVDLAGGSFTIRWLNTDDEGNSVVMRARVTELDPPNVLEISGEPHGVLRFELQADDGGTALVFTSTLDLPDEYRAKVLAGWHCHLDFLAGALDGGRADLVNVADGPWAAIHERYAAAL